MSISKNLHGTFKLGRTGLRTADHIRPQPRRHHILGPQRANLGFSDTWPLVVNTGTTIVTFLMVFLIQNTQNRDGAAMQVKLDELIRASAAQNVFFGIEKLT
jgi:low affinity Fe/Cu permease